MHRPFTVSDPTFVQDTAPWEYFTNKRAEEHDWILKIIIRNDADVQNRTGKISSSTRRKCETSTSNRRSLIRIIQWYTYGKMRHYTGNCSVRNNAGQTDLKTLPWALQDQILIYKGTVLKKGSNNITPK